MTGKDKKEKRGLKSVSETEERPSPAQQETT